MAPGNIRERCWKMWGKEHKLARLELGVGTINGEKGDRKTQVWWEMGLFDGGGGRTQ